MMIQKTEYWGQEKILYLSLPIYLITKVYFFLTQLYVAHPHTF